MSELVSLRLEGNLAWVTLNRPDVMNALSFDTLLRLREICAELKQNKSVRVVLFAAAGEKAFCAGADLKERVGFTMEKTKEFVRTIGDVFTEIARLPQPTIAVIQGIAYGGGLELALACDLRVAAAGVSMGLTETSLAIIPGAGGTVRLPRVVGQARAKELILAAKRIPAEEALRIGLVNEVAPAAELGARAKALAEAIAANGPLAVRAAKESIEAGNLDEERRLYMERVLPSKDRLEALAAFRDKRKPNYLGE